MLRNQDFKRAADLINKSNNILIMPHIKPDGDACGCMAAMADVLTALGKKVASVILSEVPEWYEFLFAQKPVILSADVTTEQFLDASFAKPDLIIILDTNSYSQLPRFSEYLKTNKQPVLVIDHHVTSDHLGDVELLDTSAAATSQIVFNLFKFAKWQITERVAQALFVAIVTDTGWFHFSNTDNAVFSDAAQLIEAGANPTQLYRALYQNFSLQRFSLMTSMLDTLELHFNGRYASQHLLEADFKQAGATHKDTENLIDECQRISTVEAAALFVELPDSRIRCSLRSMGSVDVRVIAQKYGGGGHTKAAGCYLPGPMEQAKQTMGAEFEKQLK